MLSELELTESEELGYYTTFNKLFPLFTSHNEGLKGNIDEVEINFAYTDEKSEPTKAQLAAHEFFLTHSNQILENLAKYLKQDEEYFLELYGSYNEIRYESVKSNGEIHIYKDNYGFPVVKGVCDIVNYLSINTIRIMCREEDGVSYVGFTGGCTWDDEHSFGFVFHKLELLDVGDWNSGQYFHRSKSDDNKNLLTNGFINIHCMEPLDRMKERLANLSKTVLLENKPEEYEEIFNWLVKHKMIYGYRNKVVDLTLKEKVVVLNEIKELLFYHNKIKKVPDSICILKKLTSITFDDSNLESLPLQLIKLTRLKRLTISNNKILEIPKDIILLESLEYLSFKKNKLKLIPNEIGQLTNLRHLDLGSNQLSDLPNTFSELTNLESLSLNYNSFTSFPKVISNIKSLKTLNLASNQLIHVPESIVQLLQVLDLSFNRLKTLPESLLSKMLHLQWLKVVVNKIPLEDLERFKHCISSEIDTDFESSISCVKDELNRKVKKIQKRNTNGNKNIEFSI